MSAYSDLIVSDAPLAYFRLSEGSGTVATDLSGNGRDGTYVGNVAWGASLLASDTDDGSFSLTTNADTTYPRVRWDPTAWLPTGDFTFEIWVRWEGAARLGTLFGYGGSNMLLVLCEADNRFSFAINGVAATLAAANNNLRDGNPHHLVVTRSGTTLAVYIDGFNKLGQSGFPGIAISAASRLVLGQEQDSDDGTYDIAQAWSGQLDEFAIYDRALTHAEIIEHYEAGSLVDYESNIFVSEVPPITIVRGTVVSHPQSDFPLTHPDRFVAGIVYDTAADPNPVAGATVLLIRDADGVAVSQQHSGPGGHFLFPRSRYDPHTYFVVAFSIFGGTTQVHGTSNSGLVPA